MDANTCRLDPTQGQWVVVRGPGPFTRCQFDVGFVRRREGDKVSFQNAPLGHHFNRVANVLAVRATEAEGRMVVDALRHIQALYEDEREQVSARFLERMVEMGVPTPDAANDLGDYERKHHRDRDRNRQHSPFAALTA